MPRVTVVKALQETSFYGAVAFFFVLAAFPFYWMAITSLKPDAELLSREGNPFWVHAPTLAHFKKLLRFTAGFKHLFELIGHIKMIFDGILAASCHDRDVANVRSDRFLDDVLNKRLVDERKHFLRLRFCCGKKTSSETGCRKNSFCNLHHRIN